MNIEILQLIDGAKQATGLAVIIDVFRAFSLEPYLFSQGINCIYPVGNIEYAYELKRKNPDFLLVGERNEKMPEGFDFGNSPYQASKLSLTGKTIIHTTSAGTQGIINATQADEIITGSFVNVGAIINYIRQKKPSKVSLCCMGYSAHTPTEEDTLCAEYIKQSLLGEYVNFNDIIETLRKTSGRRFFIPEKQSFAPERDFELCTKLSLFDFILKVSNVNGDSIISQELVNKVLV